MRYFLMWNFLREYLKSECFSGRGGGGNPCVPRSITFPARCFASFTEWPPSPQTWTVWSLSCWGGPWRSLQVVQHAFCCVLQGRGGTGLRYFRNPAYFFLGSKSLHFHSLEGKSWTYLVELMVQTQNDLPVQSYRSIRTFVKGAIRNVSPIPERAIAVERANRFSKYLIVTTAAAWYKKAEPEPKKKNSSLESHEVAWYQMRYSPGTEII